MVILVVSKKVKNADFVIWSGNPLSIYSKAEQTWIDGRNYFNLANDAKARIAIAEEKNSLIQKLLSEDDKKESGTDKDKTAAKAKPHQSNDFESNADAYILKQAAQWHCDDDF